MSACAKACARTFTMRSHTPQWLYSLSLIIFSQSPLIPLPIAFLSSIFTYPPWATIFALFSKLAAHILHSCSATLRRSAVLHIFMRVSGGKKKRGAKIDFCLCQSISHFVYLSHSLWTYPPRSLSRRTVVTLRVWRIAGTIRSPTFEHGEGALVD